MDVGIRIQWNPWLPHRHQAFTYHSSPCNYLKIITQAQGYFKVMGLLLDPLLNVFVQREVEHVLYHILSLVFLVGSGVKPRAYV